MFFYYIFIISDIIHPPAAPRAITSDICSVPGWIPPIAYTGIVTESQTSPRNFSPLGGSPFLQLVV